VAFVTAHLGAYVVTSKNEVTEEIKKMFSIGQHMFLFSPETLNLASNIKEVKIESIQNGYSASNTLLRLRKLEYDPSR